MYSNASCFFSKIFHFFLLLPITYFINGVFPASRDVLAISRLFSSRLYKAAKFFIYSESVVKKALFCGNFCDRNQAIILVVLVLVSLIFL